MLAGTWITKHPYLGADTPYLYAGAKVALGCVEAERTSCGRTEEELAGSLWTGTSAVGPFVLLQYPIAGGLAYAGLDRHHVYRGLSLFSVLGFFGMLALLALTPWRMGYRPLAPLLVLVLLTSPFLYYGSSTLGEGLAAFLVLLSAATALRRAPWLVLAGAAWLAGLTKETAPPFVVALGAIALLATDRGLRESTGRLLGLAGGAFAAILTSAAFNLFRYGQASNVVYLRAAHGQGNVPAVPLPQRALNLAGLLVSPNGGIALFWPTACVLLVLAVALGLRGGIRPRPTRTAALTAATLATFAGLLVGLANWYQPFGWYAWGPRLLLPWIPAFVLVLAMLQRARLVALLRWLGERPRRIWVAGLLAALPALPHVGVLQARHVVAALFDSDAACPGKAHGHALLTCVNHWAWTKHSVLLDASKGLGRAAGAVLALLLVAASVSLVALAARAAAEQSAPA
jgi:hypothetical protein